jgi:hypothetical protein
MKRTIFLVVCLLFSYGAFSQVYQLVTLNNGITITAEFISLADNMLNCKVYAGLTRWNEFSISKDSIYSVRTLDINYNYDEFDELLSDGKKMAEYEKIADRSAETINHKLYISARLIQSQTILVCKIKIQKNAVQEVPVLDINAVGNMIFLFDNGQSIVLPIRNSYVILGTTKSANSYDYAYVSLRDEDIPVFVNNNITQITIDRFTFMVDKPEILKRYILAMNDERLFRR